MREMILENVGFVTFEQDEVRQIEFSLDDYRTMYHKLLADGASDTEASTMLILVNMRAMMNEGSALIDTLRSIVRVMQGMPAVIDNTVDPFLHGEDQDDPEVSDDEGR